MSERENYFFIQLFSNATSKNVENTTVKFTNTLAKTIYLPKEESWHVALNFLLCNNKFEVQTQGEEGTFEFGADKTNDFNLSQIYVKCEQIQQLHDGRRLLSCHSRQPYDGDENRVHYYEAKNLLFFPVSVTELTDITVSLHKSNLEPLFLRLGQATTISLKFMKMSEKIVPIYISSRGKGAQSGNTASKFTIELAHYFNNYSQFIWKIALASMTYIPDFKVFPSHYSLKAYFSILDYTSEDEEDVNENTLSLQLNISRNQIMLTRDTIDNWRTEKDIRQYLQNLSDTLKFPNGEKMSTSLIFENVYRESEDEEEVVCKQPMVFIFARACKFLMPTWLAQICGFRSQQYTTIDNGITAVFAEKREKIMLAKTMIDPFCLVPHSISLICDFIQPSLVGSLQSQILRTIPVRKKFSQQQPSQTFEPKNYEYHNLNSRELSTLSFQLMDVAGNEIEFSNMQQDIIICLVLKMFA